MHLFTDLAKIARENIISLAFLFISLYTITVNFLIVGSHREIMELALVTTIISALIHKKETFEANAIANTLLALLIISIILKLTTNFSTSHLRILLGFTLLSFIKIDNKIKKKSILIIILISAVAAATYAQLNSDKGRGWETNVIIYSTMTGSLMSVCFYLTFIESKKGYRALLFVSTFLFLFATIEAKTRGTSIALILGILLTLIILKIEKQKILLPAIIGSALIAILLTSSGIKERFERTISKNKYQSVTEDVVIHNTSELGFLMKTATAGKAADKKIVFPDYGLDFNADFRLTIWILSLEVIKDNFPYGVGRDLPDIIHSLLKEHKPQYAKRAKAVHLHNQLLQNTAQFGLLGLISFTLIFFLPFYFYFKKRAGSAFLLISVFPILVASLTDAPLFNEQTVAFTYLTYFLSEKVSWS
ncbi:O-antigen ligase family protein [Oceanospirillum sanctuarii]|uniref:O-antigen ligase family protein n=1 Tax=Oceanospirillum sanctuarii TaxID=1434821 RepID=UPI000A3A16BB|nr:O-antigen ligase family protein [Oceanospirillum sanctuarii]